MPENPDAKRTFYIRQADGNIQGPFALSKIRAWIGSSKLRPEMELSEDRKNWIQCSEATALLEGTATGVSTGASEKEASPIAIAVGLMILFALVAWWIKSGDSEEELRNGPSWPVGTWMLDHKTSVRLHHDAHKSVIDGFKRLNIEDPNLRRTIVERAKRSAERDPVKDCFVRFDSNGDAWSWMGGESLDPTGSHERGSWTADTNNVAVKWETHGPSDRYRIQVDDPEERIVYVRTGDEITVNEEGRVLRYGRVDRLAGGEGHGNPTGESSSLSRGNSTALLEVGEELALLELELISRRRPSGIDTRWSPTTHSRRARELLKVFICMTVEAVLDRVNHPQNLKRRKIKLEGNDAYDLGQLRYLRPGDRWVTSETRWPAAAVGANVREFIVASHEVGA